MPKYIVAITGASGAVYGVRLIDELLAGGNDVELIISSSGFLLLREEMDLDCSDVNAAEVILGHIEETRAARDNAGERKKGFLSSARKRSGGRLACLPNEDLTGAPASGSSLRRAMVICPCSMGTLARIATGVSGNLIERAADCVLKERGTLVMVPRETPFNTIHLENMHKLSATGAVILPAMPGFYTRPATVDDMVDFVVGKTLDVLGVENDLYKRWKSS